MRHLVPLLDALTKEMRKGMDLNHEIGPVDDPRGRDGCPMCGEAMCLVYARTTARRDDAIRHARDEAEGMGRRTRVAAAGRRAGDLIGGGLLG